MTPEQEGRLKAAISKFRQRHGGDSFSANTMHPGWDSVADAEELMAGRLGIITDPDLLAEELESAVR